MPLIWAHAEFLKLLVGRETRRPAELLEAVWQRYKGKRPTAETWYWRSAATFDTLPSNRSLVVEDSEPFVLHVGTAGWQELQDRTSQPIGLGMHGVRIDRSELARKKQLNFTRFYPQTSRWEGEDHTVELDHEPGGRRARLRSPKNNQGKS